MQADIDNNQIVNDDADTFVFFDPAKAQTKGQASPGIQRRDFLYNVVQARFLNGFAATVVIEASCDGINWDTIYTFEGNGIYHFTEDFWPYLRARRTDAVVDGDGYGDAGAAISVILCSGGWFTR